MPIKITIILFISICTFSLRSEPWIDTRDAWLRADIEVLSEAGIITIPTSTYPLMWSGIIQDIDNTDIRDINTKYKDVYWRVKKAGKTAVSRKPKKELRLSVSNGEQVLRSFGEETRGKTEIAARSFNMNKNFAWNIEVTRVNVLSNEEPQDGDSTRYDGSYVSSIMGNWVTSVGNIDKWWGAGWDSTNLLSNNARAPLGVSLQRNYSNQSDNIVFNWLGPWTFNTFIAKLDDTRLSKDSKLSGLSFNFKPTQTLELGFRVTAMFGGKNLDGSTRAESFSSLTDNWLANESCEPIVEVAQETVCNALYSDIGNRIAGLDIKWRLPIEFNTPVSIYFSQYGESETELLPSKNMTQYGITSSVDVFGSNWKWFVESSNTRLRNDFNSAYESSLYATGYRYNLRAIGSTFDNDSKVISFGVIGGLNQYNKLSLTFTNAKLNIDGQNASVIGIHSITESEKIFKRINLNWLYQTRSYGNYKLSVDYSDEIYDEFQRLDDNTRIGLEWSYNFGS
jgi:hypothetical protein